MSSCYPEKIVNSNRPQKPDRKQKLHLTPISDTISGFKAKSNPGEILAHYDTLAQNIWLAPQVEKVGEEVLAQVRNGHTAWGSISGPYGFGKTAAMIALWQYAKTKDFLSIPPLSCTNFDELAGGIAALAKAQMPKAQKKIELLYKGIYKDEINQLAKSDAERYGVSPDKLRRLLEEKLQRGQLTLDGGCHRLVEFVSRLGELSTEWSAGLIVILDELQQLLGPLDVRAITQFREFVWGMRTERSHCGIILSLDSQLEARLSNWASDVLHRIRENGPSLPLALVYTREFPFWLWEKLISASESETPQIDNRALTQDVLYSLGQFVERSDLATGPRTVIDVISRASDYYQTTNQPYDLPQLVDDIHYGHFRYFGEGAFLQTIVTQLLNDEWIAKDKARKIFIGTIAVFPLGCPQEILQRFVPNKKELRRVQSELFAPLLVELHEGLALESLQQVRRPNLNWEQILWRSWETMPANDALVAHSPDIIKRVLLTRLFPRGDNFAQPQWELTSNAGNAELTGWLFLRGTFAEEYPKRDVAVWIATDEPHYWPQEADVCFAFVCDDKLDSNESSAEVLTSNQGSCLLFRLPLLKKLSVNIPFELLRFEKFVSPEPFRPATVLAAIYALESHVGNLDETDKGDDSSDTLRIRAFIDMVLGYIIRELLQGVVTVAERTFTQRGNDLLRTLFIFACRNKYPNYHTLINSHKWQDVLKVYGQALRNEKLNIEEKQGRTSIVMRKDKMLLNFLGQRSTAVGDSLLRTLGSLVQVSGTTENFQLHFSLHPAEKNALDYMRSLKHQLAIPKETIFQFLRHQGYVLDEAKALIQIMLDREFIITSDKNDVCLVKNNDATHGLLMEKILETQSSLAQLGRSKIKAFSKQLSSLTHLQAYLCSLEEELENQVQVQITEQQQIVTKLQSMIGKVMAQDVPQDWAKTDLSIHLTGAAKILLQTKQNLLKALRKDLNRLEGVITDCSTNQIKLAVYWSKKKDIVERSVQNSNLRLKQFLERSTCLMVWVLANHQLFLTKNLCDNISTSGGGPGKKLEVLVDEYRETLATESWEAIISVDVFESRLRNIQKDVQSMLYDHFKAYNDELKQMRCQFSHLLPATPPPEFVSIVEKNKFYSISKAFQQLHKWAIGGLRAAFEQCCQVKAKGTVWRDQRNRRTSWQEVEGQVTVELRKAEAGTPNFKTILQLAKKIARLQDGFTAGPNGKLSVFAFGTYDNPQQPPDFKSLKDMFLSGEIVIQVDLKKE